MIENLKGEEWKPVNRFPNYEVSSFGRIKSIPLANKQDSTRREKVLRLVPRVGKYIQVTLYNGEIRENFYIHRLVASHFIENTDSNKTYVHHLDANPSNNHVNNLQWTNSQDHGKTWRKGSPTFFRSSGQDHGNSKLNNEAVLSIRKLFSTGKYSASEIARLYSMDRSYMAKIVNGKAWAHV